MTIEGIHSHRDGRLYQTETNTNTNTNSGATEGGIGAARSEIIREGCSGCTCGVGQVIVGALIGAWAVAAESICCLCSGVAVAACGVGNFFSGLYNFFTGICGRSDTPSNSQ